MLQTFRKSICLVKEIILVNPFICVFWGILRQVSQYLPRKTPPIFVIFPIILWICCCHLVVYYLTKPFWNCVSKSQICCSGCCSLSLSLSSMRTSFLLVTRYFSLVARYFSLVARYFLLVTCYFLLVTRHFLLVTFYILLVTC